MSAPIAVNTLVLIVRTGTGLDGATGVVEGGLEWRACHDVRHGSIGMVLGYAVRLARLTPWGEVMSFSPEYVVPIAPPGEPTDTEITNEMPAHALV